MTFECKGPACKQRSATNFRVAALVYFLFWCIYPNSIWLNLGLEPLSAKFIYTVVLTITSLIFFVELTKSKTGLLVTTFLVALLTVDIFLVNTHQTRISSSAIFVIWNESSLAIDFFTLHYGSILLHILIFASLLISITIWRQGKKTSGIRLFALFIPILTLTSISFLFHKFYYKLPDTTSLFVTLEKDRGSLFFGLNQIALAAKATHDFREISTSRSKNNLTAKSQATKAIYVLVIGESSRPQNWGLYGYHRETNPRLILRDNIFTFTDLVTTAPLTMDAIVSMLSLASVDQWNEIMSNPSIISIIKNQAHGPSGLAFSRWIPGPA